MNNNRGNNRRRGRGNNRQQGGGQQTNRIDSRARGNAPQLLEKYRKLAHDAHLNGDRVTEEYYLQFADHYFRVLADARTRQEEARQPRSERWQEGGDNDRDDSDAGSEYSGESEYSANPYNYGERREREERPRYEERPRHEEREQPANTEQRAESGGDEERNGSNAQPSLYEPAENPFVQGRGPRGLKPRRPRRESSPAPDGEATTAAEAPREENRDEPAPSGLDLAVLPPAISARESGEIASEEPAAAKPKRRSTRRPKPPADDADEALQVVN